MDKEINILESLNKKDISIATLIILNIIIPNVLNFRINAIEHNLNMLSFTVIQLSIVLSLIYVCFKYINCFVESQSELHQEKIYNKTLVELVDSLRLLKHDYNNILQAINGYIITKQYDQLDEHIKRLSKDSKNISKVEAINPEIINQPAIYGIIGAKYFRAVNKNIDFSLSINTNISEISFDFTELSRILGILLDNAIEASEKSDNPHISIKFSYNKFKQADMIEIKNTIAKNSKIDLNKIFNKGVSSKTIKSGLGLWEVKKIISSKSNSQIFADVNNNEFSQTIIVEKN
ncbi:MAG: Spo0B domain-containing protein [Clostridia bacterium]|nr:Spo0B domain-containing protein [Clostridia bacterium]